jgi:hypothetical protein
MKTTTAAGNGTKRIYRIIGTQTGYMAELKELGLSYKN